MLGGRPGRGRSRPPGGPCWAKRCPQWRRAAEGKWQGAETAVTWWPATPPRTDGLCTAQAAGLLGVLQDGLAGGQRIIATGAFEGAQRLAPWRSMTSLPDVSLGDSLLIGAKPLRFTFSRFY
jgi:hypothetical protein